MAVARSDDGKEQIARPQRPRVDGSAVEDAAGVADNNASRRFRDHRRRQDHRHGAHSVAFAERWRRRAKAAWATAPSSNGSTRSPIC